MRALTWDGLTNARDLGGLPTRSGQTRVGAVVRSEHPESLTEAGWDAARAYGISTIVSLRTAGMTPDDDAVANVPVRAPWPVDQRDVAIEDASDVDFVARFWDTGLIATPLYYLDALRRWPQRHAEALATIAESPGPVLMHCAAGFDRTGLMAVLLLDNAGVTASAIADDYLLSFENRRLTHPDEVAARERLLADHGLTARTAITEVVGDLEQVFWSTGAVDDATRDRLRARLIDG